MDLSNPFVIITSIGTLILSILYMGGFMSYTVPSELREKVGFWPFMCICSFLSYFLSHVSFLFWYISSYLVHFSLFIVLILIEKTVYDYTISTRDGEEVDMSVYQGRVLLIANVASF